MIVSMVGKGCMNGGPGVNFLTFFATLEGAGEEGGEADEY
jgi:hypothetical protein